MRNQQINETNKNVEWIEEKITLKIEMRCTDQNNLVHSLAKQTEEERQKNDWMPVTNILLDRPSQKKCS